MKPLLTLIALLLVVGAQPAVAQDPAQPQNVPKSTLNPASTFEPAAAEERNVVIPLEHASVESALPIVKQLLPANARIVGDPERQQLFLFGSQADIEKAYEIVKHVDRPAKATTTANPLNPSAPTGYEGMPLEAYRSDFIRQLQSQLQLPAQQQTLPLKTGLQRQYEAAEQEAQAAAQQWRQLTAKSGDVQTTVEIGAARAKLQAAVAKAFDARQKLQQAELLDMQRRIYSLAGTIDSREKLKDQIIDRRVQELLNPALDWNPPATSSAATTTKGSSLPQYPLRRYPATGSLQGAPAKAAPAQGVIVQVRGDLVDVYLGSDDGIAAGQTLHVFRGNEYVAELEVLVLVKELDRLVARIKRKLSSLRPDDRVSTKEPVQAADDSSAGSIPSDAGRPLSDAVREFNAANADNPLSKGQPPLTDDEVVAAIRWTTRDRTALGLEAADFQALTSIAESRLLPPGARLELKTDFLAPDPLSVRDGRKLTKWTIFVAFPSSHLTPGSVPIREQYIRSERPATEHSTLIADWTPLTPAIDAFNERHRSHSIGKDQPPITKDEILTALRVWLTRREKLPVTNAEFRELEKIAATEQLPPGAELEVLTSFQPDNEWQFEAWSVRLRVSHGPDGGRGGGSYAYTIRDRWLKARRIGERKISWGPKADNGLQVGLWLDPASEVFAKGQQVVPHFFFRNAGDKELGISLPRIMTHSYYEAMQVTDDKGEAIQIDQDGSPGGPVGWTQLPFTPGAMHEVVGLPIVLGQVKRPPGVETVICAAEGQECRLRFSVDNYLDPDAAEKARTGEVRFRLAGP